MAKETKNTEVETNNTKTTNTGLTAAEQREIDELNAMIEAGEEEQEQVDYRTYKVEMVADSYDLKEDGIQLLTTVKNLENGELTKHSIKVYNNPETGFMFDDKIANGLLGKELTFTNERRTIIRNEDGTERAVFMADAVKGGAEAEANSFYCDVMVDMVVAGGSVESTGKNKGTSFQSSIQNGTRKDLYTVLVKGRVYSVQSFVGRTIRIHDLETKKTFTGETIHFTDNSTIKVIA
jgi:hypothetical protein